jgi:hypothetical protein
MSKKLEDMTFEELVEHTTEQVHFGLLEGGSREMKARIHLWMGHAIAWDRIKIEKSRPPVRRRGIIN